MDGKMSYWLIIFTLFWAGTYGNYGSKEECEAAAREWRAEQGFLSVSTPRCLPMPKNMQHSH